MLFEMILMKFDTSELLAADALIGPICFTVFIFFVVFVGMTMFISIISDSFRVVRTNREKVYQDGDHQMFGFMFDQFQRWIGEIDRWLLHEQPIGHRLRSSTCSLGMKKTNGWEEYDRHMRSQYFDPVEHFPDKMDQLLHALNKVDFFDRAAAWFHSGACITVFVS